MRASEAKDLPNLFPAGLGPSAATEDTGNSHGISRERPNSIPLILDDDGFFAEQSPV